MASLPDLECHSLILTVRTLKNDYLYSNLLQNQSLMNVFQHDMQHIELLLSSAYPVFADTVVNMSVSVSVCLEPVQVQGRRRTNDMESSGVFYHLNCSH